MRDLWTNQRRVQRAQGWWAPERGWALGLREVGVQRIEVAELPRGFTGGLQWFMGITGSPEDRDICYAVGGEIPGGERGQSAEFWVTETRTAQAADLRGEPFVAAAPPPPGFVRLAGVYCDGANLRAVLVAASGARVWRPLRSMGEISAYSATGYVIPEGEVGSIGADQAARIDAAMAPALRATLVVRHEQSKERYERAAAQAIERGADAFTGPAATKYVSLDREATRLLHRGVQWIGPAMAWLPLGARQRRARWHIVGIEQRNAGSDGSLTYNVADGWRAATELPEACGKLALYGNEGALLLTAMRSNGCFFERDALISLRKSATVPALPPFEGMALRSRTVIQAGDTVAGVLWDDERMYALWQRPEVGLLGFERIAGVGEVTDATSLLYTPGRRAGFEEADWRALERGVRAMMKAQLTL